MEYGNGIVGDMCIHMLDMVRWMLDLGWPKRDQLDRRHPRAEGRQVEHHRHADGDVRLRRPAGRLAAPHLGRPARPGVPVGRRSSTATRARSRSSVHKYDFIPAGQEEADASAATPLIEQDKYPEDKTEKDLELHVAPANRRHLQDFLAGDRSRAASRSPTSSRATSRRRAASWPTSSMQLGRSLTWDAGEAPGRRRRRGEQAAAAAVPQGLDAPGGVTGPGVPGDRFPSGCDGRSPDTPRG